MLRKFFGLFDSAKDRYFSRLYNDWRNMFININKENWKNVFLFSLICFQNMSKWAENVKEHWNWVFISFLSKHLCRELKTFETSYLSIINYLQHFSIFSIFLFLLIFFKFTPLWIAIYRIRHHWLCFIFSVWLRRNGYLQKKKKMQLVNTPLFSVSGCFHLSQSAISKDLIKIATSVNVSRD